MVKENKAKKPFYKKWWFIVICVLFVFIVIGASGGEKENKVAENKADSKIETTESNKTEQPTASPTPTEEPVKGTRKSPYTLNETAAFDGMKSTFYSFIADLTMTEIIRGEEAYNLVMQGSKYNDVPPEGKEYILAKFKIKALESKNDEKIDMNEYMFDFVSAEGIKYNDFVNVSGLEPKLTEIYAGAEIEGWAYQLVDISDTPSIVFCESVKKGVWFSTAQ